MSSLIPTDPNVVAPNVISNLRTQPAAWFSHYDIQGKGFLSKEQISAAILLSYPTLTPDGAKGLVDDVWDDIESSVSDSLFLGCIQVINFNGSDGVNKEDFLRRGGLCERLLSKLTTPAAKDTEVAAPTVVDDSLPVARLIVEEDIALTYAFDIPDIFSNPREWFQYFDRENTGYLNREQCSNALSQTFLTMDSEIINNMLEALWPLFDSTGAGMLSSDDFLRSEGLHETLLGQITPVQREQIQEERLRLRGAHGDRLLSTYGPYYWPCCNVTCCPHSPQNAGICSLCCMCSVVLFGR